MGALSLGNASSQGPSKADLPHSGAKPGQRPNGSASTGAVTGLIRAPSSGLLDSIGSRVLPTGSLGDPPSRASTPPPAEPRPQPVLLAAAEAAAEAAPPAGAVVAGLFE
jgi:hypothetical protein